MLVGGCNIEKGRDVVTFWEKYLCFWETPWIIFHFEETLHNFFWLGGVNILGKPFNKKKEVKGATCVENDKCNL